MAYNIKCEHSDFEFLLACACRYNIGRMTYSPHQFIGIVRKHFDELSPVCLRWILDDIERYPEDKLGMHIDTEEWLKLRDDINAKLMKVAQNARYDSSAGKRK